MKQIQAGQYNRLFYLAICTETKSVTNGEIVRSYSTPDQTKGLWGKVTQIRGQDLVAYSMRVATVGQRIQFSGMPTIKVTDRLVDAAFGDTYQIDSWYRDVPADEIVVTCHSGTTVS